MNASLWLRLAAGLLLAAMVSALAYRARALATSGAVAASLIGAVVFGLGGLTPTILLLAFFLSSSALSLVGRQRKRALEAVAAKGARRDARQVLANGGLAASCAALWGLSGSEPFLAAVVGALAAATADTWGTEIGVLSPAVPRRVTDWQPVAVGASGGVTLYGSVASLAGAGLIGLLAVLMQGGGRLLVAGLTGGLLGAAADSLLGASLQAGYWCPVCQRATEHTPVHGCGSPTQLQRGLAWLDNDGVNLVATLVGAATAALVAALAVD
ncbi:MAG TPA: DUF92 domain-containing protein [Anaerolineales bacterium]|jgi:uncharacterized protein (TIGR00297 family)